MNRSLETIDQVAENGHRQSTAELNALKDTIMSRGRVVQKDLSAMAKQYHDSLHRQHTSHEGVVQRYFLQTLEWLGFGHSYKIARHLKQMRQTSAQLGVVTANLREEQEDYACKDRELIETLGKNEQLLALNKNLADNLYRELEEARAQRAAIKSASPFSETTSAEAMMLENRIIDLKTDADKIDLEQDVLLMQVEGELSKKEMCNVGYTLSTSMLSEFARQKAMFDTHLDRVEFYSRISKGTGDANIMRHFTKAAEQIEKLSKLAGDIYSNPFDKMPKELRIGVSSPQLGQGKREHGSYWRANIGRVFERLDKYRA